MALKLWGRAFLEPGVSLPRVCPGHLRAGTAAARPPLLSRGLGYSGAGQLLYPGIWDPAALEGGAGRCGAGAYREGSLGARLTLIVEPLNLADGVDAGRSPEQALRAESCGRKTSRHLTGPST